MTRIADTLTGVYETHLPVADLARSIAFYRDQVGLELASEFPERGVAFFWVGGAQTGMLGLWRGVQGPMSMALHFAFRAPKECLLTACDDLRAAGIEPLGFYGEPVSEPVVIGWMPALSVYFRDPDGHSLELLHVLDDAPDRTFGVQPWSAWQARD
ncbi:MAG: VOC family protein [Rhodobacter sp.]|nr:VOC family protein [Paracoccaceae bacterium]MCC0077727.1 VOC family protein [Rhodobacter sp.]